MIEIRSCRLFLMTILSILFILFFACTVSVRAFETVGGTITYSTSRSVYVALEGTENVAAGDTLLVGFGVPPFVPVAVKAVSPQKIVFQAVSLFDETQAGSIVLVQLPTQTESITEAKQRNLERNIGSENITQKNYLDSLSGRVSVQYYRYRGPQGATEYDQPSTYFSTSYDGIAGKPSRLNIRLRSRVHREISLPNGGKTDTERTMRLYDFSFEWGGENSGWYACLGRTRRIRSPGMGGLDGFVLEHAVGDDFRVGLFGGIAPELDNFIGDTKDIKRGAYILWQNGDRGSSLRLNTAISYIAKTLPDEPIMHLLYLDQIIQYSSFRLSQEAVVNVMPEGDGRASNSLQNIRSFLKRI
ncbi:hypothetical protein ACFL6K_05440 [Candidatus Latescibacterota bacterium]